MMGGGSLYNNGREKTQTRSSSSTSIKMEAMAAMVGYA
jgi:hypothetical protein